MVATTSFIDQGQWIKILNKGLITIPKNFREEMNLKEGEIARIRRIGKRLIIEPRDIVDYELYTDKEFSSMLKEDKLPANLAKKAASIWSDLK